MKACEERAVVGVRLWALAVFTVGLWVLAGNVLDSLVEFNPAYLRYYAMSQLMRPLLAMVLGVMLGLGSRKLGRCLARGLDKA